MSLNGSESLNFDTFNQFKQWKESLKADRGLQFSFQWSRVQKGSQFWRYTCKHVRITETHPHKFAYMMVAIEDDGKVQVELNAPNINLDLYGRSSSPLRDVHSEETSQAGDPAPNHDKIAAKETTSGGTESITEPQEEQGNNAQDSTDSEDRVEKFVRVEESKTDEDEDDDYEEPIVKHARPWENNPAVSNSANFETSVKVMTSSESDLNSQKGRHAVPSDGTKSRKKSRNCGEMLDDIVIFSKRPVECVPTRDGPQQTR